MPAGITGGASAITTSGLQNHLSSNNVLDINNHYLVSQLKEQRVQCHRLVLLDLDNPITFPDSWVTAGTQGLRDSSRGQFMDKTSRDRDQGSGISGTAVGTRGTGPRAVPLPRETSKKELKKESDHAITGDSRSSGR